MSLKNVLANMWVLMLLITSGCAGTPPVAPQLSIELGNRISAIEDANITLLHRFFDQKRSDVDRFIEEAWLPVFVGEFFSEPKVARVWDVIVSENNKEDRLKFIVSTGPKLQKKINSKRLELIKPLDDLERRIENKIRAEYNQARAINNSLTSFLLSASKVAENRDRYLEMAEVTDDKIGKVINKTDHAVSDLLKHTKNVQEKIDAGERYLEKIRGIMEGI